MYRLFEGKDIYRGHENLQNQLASNYSGKNEIIPALS